MPKTKKSSDIDQHKVVSVKPRAGYNLELVFSDGLEGLLCIKELLTGPVFEPLKDEAIFAQVSIEKHFGGIRWPTGADLCPDSLYTDVVAAKAGSDDADMKKEYDFSNGKRGRFYIEEIELNLPDNHDSGERKK